MPKPSTWRRLEPDGRISSGGGVRDRPRPVATPRLREDVDRARDHEQNGHRRDAGFGEHQVFAECVGGIVSVGRNAIELVKEWRATGHRSAGGTGSATARRTRSAASTSCNVRDGKIVEALGYVKAGLRS